MSEAPLARLRGLVQSTWEDVGRWLAQKPGVLTLPHPEQQILFEYAERLRFALRALAQNPSWDRLYFDATTVTFERALLPLEGRRPPIFIDTRQLFGLGAHVPRDATAPDFAIALQVLRSVPELVELDDEGRMRRGHLPPSLKAQGWLLEEHVQHLEELSANACDAFLFVVYSNDARRVTAVDRREVASWASWQRVTETLWWTSRHFRARPKA